MSLLEEDPPAFDFTPPEIEPSHRPDESEFKFELEEEAPPPAKPVVSTVEMGLSAASEAAAESEVDAESEPATESIEPAASSLDDESDCAAGLEEPGDAPTGGTAEAPSEAESLSAPAAQESDPPSNLTDEAVVSEPATTVEMPDDGSGSSDSSPGEASSTEEGATKPRRRRKPRRGRKKDRGGKSDGKNTSSGGPPAGDS